MTRHPPVILKSSLAIDECKSRLAASVDAEHLAFTISGYRGSKPFVGKIRDGGFRLQKRRNYKNSFAPYFYGTFKAVDGGTLVEGEFRMHPATRIFMGFWFCFLALFFVSVLVWPASQTQATDRVTLLGFAALMGTFGVGLSLFGNRLGASEQDAILSYLKTEFAASALA